MLVKSLLGAAVIIGLSAPPAHARTEYPGRDHVRQLLVPAAASAYRGAEMVPNFIEDIFAARVSVGMKAIFSTLTAKERRALGWGGYYPGSTSQFRKDRAALIVDGAINPHYAGWRGYLNFARECAKDDLRAAHRRAVGVLSDEEWERLDWPSLYVGSPADFLADRARILDQRGQIVAAYRAPPGLWLFADRFYGGGSKRAFANIWSCLTRYERATLGWRKQFFVTTAEVCAERARLFANDEFRAEYLNADGYARYAAEFYGNHMKPAALHVFSVLSREEWNRLGWVERYHGRLGEFLTERNRLFVDGRLLETYRGPLGYAAYADLYYGGKMTAAFLNVAAVLSEEERKALGWRMFTESTTTFRAMRTFLTRSGGLASMPHRWFGKMDGLPNLVSEFIAETMPDGAGNAKLRAAVRQRFRALVSEVELYQLGWQSAAAKPTCADRLTTGRSTAAREGQLRSPTSPRLPASVPNARVL